MLLLWIYGCLDVRSERRVKSLGTGLSYSVYTGSTSVLSMIPARGGGGGTASFRESPLHFYGNVPPIITAITHQVPFANATYVLVPGPVRSV